MITNEREINTTKFNIYEFIVLSNTLCITFQLHSPNVIILII